MNLTEIQGASAAADLLGQGYILQDLSGAALFAMKDSRILVSSRSCTMRLSREDFFSLYEYTRFALRPGREGLDEQKDQEYYAWAAHSQ